MLPEQLAKIKNSQFNRITVKSALNPALFLTTTTLVGGTVGIFYFSTNFMLTIFFMCVISLPLICACVALIYFTFWNPESLRSEEFQLKLEQYRMLKSKGGLREINPELLKVINNPLLPQLQSASQNEEEE